MARQVKQSFKVQMREVSTVPDRQWEDEARKVAERYVEYHDPLVRHEEDRKRNREECDGMIKLASEIRHLAKQLPGATDDPAWIERAARIQRVCNPNEASQIEAMEQTVARAFHLRLELFSLAEVLRQTAEDLKQRSDAGSKERKMFERRYLIHLAARSYISICGELPGKGAEGRFIKFLERCSSAIPDGKEPKGLGGKTVQNEVRAWLESGGPDAVISGKPFEIL